MLTLASLGYANKQIAAAMGIDEETVKGHLTAIMQKLRVNNRTEAVVAAMRRGWIE